MTLKSGYCFCLGFSSNPCFCSSYQNFYQNWNPMLLLMPLTWQNREIIFTKNVLTCYANTVLQKNILLTNLFPKLLFYFKIFFLTSIYFHLHNKECKKNSFHRVSAFPWGKQMANLTWTGCCLNGPKIRKSV